MPSVDKVNRFRRLSVPESVYQRLKARYVSDSLVWLHLIQHPDDELVEHLCQLVGDLAADNPCEGLLTWCNYASLSEAGRRLGLPVIHCELGPLRDPWYLPLGYLDFTGVNGHTQAERRWHASPALDPCCADLDTLHRFLSRQDIAAFPGTPDAALGIPLQVEDDSNVLAYGRGFDMTLLMQYAQETYRNEVILVRPHPGAHLTPKPGPRIDRSKTSAAFVARCERILTLSSSVAVEAMLQGKPVTLLGESPARHLAGATLETARVATLAELEFLSAELLRPLRPPVQRAVPALATAHPWGGRDPGASLGGAHSRPRAPDRVNRVQSEMLNRIPHRARFSARLRHAWRGIGLRPRQWPRGR